METVKWKRRLADYRYSLDDRTMSHKFSKELEKEILAFLDDNKKTTLLIGTFNIAREPWRMLAINDYKKFGVKLLEKPINETMTEIHLIKKPLSQHLSGF